ncbi:MAG: hypothetical protein ABI977_04220 [Acidobacteriota bacterium]
MINTTQTTDYQVQILHYPTDAGERWRAVVLSFPAVVAEGASREQVLAEVKDRLAEIDSTIEIVTLPIASLSGSANRNGDYSEQNSNPVEASLAERLRARGWTDFDRFADDPGALELFDEIERERDKHLVGGE